MTISNWFGDVDCVSERKSFTLLLVEISTLFRIRLQGSYNAGHN
jgi:hypothetical protein